MQEIQEMQVQSLSWEDILEEGMATHSNIPAWRIWWTEEPGGLWSIESQIVGHDWSDLAHTLLVMKKNTYIFFTNIIRIHSLCLGENITKMWIQGSGIFTKGWNSDIMVSLSLLWVSMLTYYWKGWISQNFPNHFRTSEPLPPTTTIYSKGLPFYCIMGSLDACSRSEEVNLL